MEQASTRRHSDGSVANFADVKELGAAADVQRLPLLAEDAQIAAGIHGAGGHSCRAQALDGAIDGKSLGDAVQRVVAEDAIEEALARESNLFRPVEHAPRPRVERRAMARAQARDIALALLLAHRLVHPFDCVESMVDR